jgi:hypothetical protein
MRAPNHQSSELGVICKTGHYYQQLWRVYFTYHQTRMCPGYLREMYDHRRHVAFCRILLSWDRGSPASMSELQTGLELERHTAMMTYTCQASSRSSGCERTQKEAFNELSPIS